MGTICILSLEMGSLDSFGNLLYDVIMKVCMEMMENVIICASFAY